MYTDNTIITGPDNNTIDKENIELGHRKDESQIQMKRWRWSWGRTRYWDRQIAEQRDLYLIQKVFDLHNVKGGGHVHYNSISTIALTYLLNIEKYGDVFKEDWYESILYIPV